MKKGILKISQNSHLYHNVFLNKNLGLKPANLFEKNLWHRCFTVNFAKSLRTPSLQNTFWRQPKIRY